MGQPLTIQNQTSEDIFVEWRSSPGGVFAIANYSIGAGQRRSHTAEAWWYEISITHKGNRLMRVFNGSVAASWAFNGTHIYSTGRSESESLSPAESGVVTVPLDHPVVKSVISYFQSLEVSPQQQ